METPRTYVPFQDWKEKSKQTEYTESTPLLAPTAHCMQRAGQDTMSLNTTETMLKKAVL